ncbi:MAG: hypothetical protein HY720_03870 [Planctomycetes bacterium]|nr:hypothetical protein [Planctomycetota bacterium]
MAKRKPKARRTRSPHPGVKMLRRSLPSGAVTWEARWRDPDTRRVVKASLSRLGLGSDEVRRDWAIRKSKALAARAASLAAGGEPRGEPMEIGEAINDYLTRAADRLAPATVYGYRLALAPLAEWCEANGARTLHDLTPGRLAAFRDLSARRRKRAPTAKGRRGERHPSTVPLSPASVNHDLDAVRIFFFEARRLGRLPQLDPEKIAESLSRVRGRLARPAFLRRPEIRKVLEAALRHDGETFALTREEKAGLAPEGSTPRFVPIAPYALFVLLSGCRAGEARGLRWEHVHATGEAPEIILPATLVKTREERSIDLAVSPSLVSLLGALRVRSGGTPFVFGGGASLSREVPEKARLRLVKDYGAPSSSWQRLRQTCATFLNCAPGIYGGGAAFLASKRHGHSVLIAEKRYVGLLRDLPKDATTLEQAMGIEDLAGEIVRRVAGAAPLPEAEEA